MNVVTVGLELAKNLFAVHRDCQGGGVAFLLSRHCRVGFLV